MVHSKKKFRKILLESEDDTWKRESIARCIDDSLSSGKLFTLDTEILSNLRYSLNFRNNDHQNVVRKVRKKDSINKSCATNGVNERSLKKICSLNNDELDIWGDSIVNLEVKSASSPGERLRIKGPSIQLPRSGQSINPLESDRQDALYKLSSVSNAGFIGKYNKIPTSFVNSFISNYYESEDVLRLTESQKYLLVNSLLNGEILNIDSIKKLKYIQNVKGKEDENLYFRRENFGTRKKRSEVNKENRRKKEILFKKEKEKVKKLNKDVQNIDIVIQDIDEVNYQLESRRTYLSILQEQLNSAKRSGILSKVKIGRNTYKEVPMTTLSEADILSSNGSLRKLHIENKSLSKDIISNIYRKGLTEIPPINDAQYGRRLQKLLRRNKRTKKIAKKSRFFN